MSTRERVGGWLPGESISRESLDHEVDRLFDARGTVPMFTTLPAATARHRAKLIILKGGALVADVLYCCMKSATDTYSWRPIITG